DSTVCLNLALEVARARNRLPLDVVFFDEEVLPPPTVEYVERVRQLPDVNMRWYALEHRCRNFCSREEPFWYNWDSEKKDLWVREMPKHAITNLTGYVRGMKVNQCNGLLFDPKEHGTVGFILGIRTDESIRRFQYLTQKKEENYITLYREKTQKGGLYKVHPIYDWTFNDVWTAPKLFGWDYNRTYDILEQAGVPRVHQRVHVPFGEMGSQVFHTYKTCFPEFWEKMLRRVPGVNTAARYFSTELYGWKDVPKKPDHMSYEEYLLHLLKKQPKDWQPKIAKRLRKEIQRHYRITSDPILYDVAHPETGLHWKYLIKIAMRGDIAGRRSARYHNTERTRKKYHEALLQWELEEDEKERY
ncbi:MAG: DUF3440 domain-containing protein, partial [Thermoactinomyces sp.]